MSASAKLVLEGRPHELPVLVGTEGEKAVDISALRDTTGYVTFDTALDSTGVCRSAITFIDGEKGILRYRGIPIQQFNTPSPNFVEVAWLLIFGRLPRVEEMKRFSGLLTLHAPLHESFKHNFEGVPVAAPPMAVLSAMISTLACYHPEFLGQLDDTAFEEVVARLVSKVRTIASFTYRRTRGLPYIYPHPKFRYCANFLHMMFSMPYEEYEVDREIEDALNLLLILHADHEQNCSTAVCRTVGSARANLFASCAAAVCALWGARHGGANLEVIEMLERIHGGGVTAQDCVRMAKDRDNPFRLSGFGHRVYKNFDPRARILKDAADKVLRRLGRQDPLLDIARQLEEMALTDAFFVERKLYPNVDFYSGIILRAIGIPKSMFPVMFAIGRLPGWIAQWKEQHDDPTQRIYRPRQIYVGPNQQEYVPVEKR